MLHFLLVVFVAAGFSAPTGAHAKDKKDKAAKAAQKALKEATGFSKLKQAMKSERPLKETYRTADRKIVEALNYQGAGITFSASCVKSGGKFGCAALKSLKTASQLRLARNELADGVTPGEVLRRPVGVFAVADIRRRG